MVLKFLAAATGVSRQQTERLVRQWRETGAVRDRRAGGRPFARKYAAVDIRLLPDVDKAYGQISGLATRESGTVPDSTAVTRNNRVANPKRPHASPSPLTRRQSPSGSEPPPFNRPTRST